MHFKSSKIINILLFCVFTFLSLILAEKFLEWLAPRFGLVEPYYRHIAKDWYGGGKWVPDENLSYGMGKNLDFKFQTKEWSAHVRTNEFGYRGPSFLEEKPSIFLIGDSMIQALQVSEGRTGADILQKLLNQNSQNYQVHNLGIGSYSTIQYYNQLRIYGEKWPPKIAILTIFPNDIPTDYFRHVASGAAHDASDIVVRLAPEPIAYPEGFQRLYLYWAWKHFWRVVTNKIENPDGYWGVFNENDPYKLTELYLKASKDWADKHGVKLIVTAFPFPNQVGPGQIPPGYHTIATTRNEFESREYYPNRLREIAEKNKIPYLDLLSALRVYAKKGEKLYFPIDGHFNELGNQRFAEILFQYLVSNKLI